MKNLISLHVCFEYYVIGSVFCMYGVVELVSLLETIRFACVNLKKPWNT